MAKNPWKWPLLEGNSLYFFIWDGPRWPLNVIWRWPLLGGLDIKETMGKRLGLRVSGRYREVAAIGRWPLLEVRLYIL